MLSPEQARAFLDAAKGERLEALYTVALSLGLQMGEALGLRWQYIDFERRVLTVNRILERIGRGQGSTLQTGRTEDLALAPNCEPACLSQLAGCYEVPRRHHKIPADQGERGGVAGVHRAFSPSYLALNATTRSMTQHTKASASAAANRTTPTA
jgi:hypothetical protein